MSFATSIQYYDVQVELVDHLASAIEKLWETQPEIPFEEAVYFVGEQFGGELGFYTIRKEKEKAIKKEYLRILCLMVAEFYKFPKIIITLGISLALYCCFSLVENDAWVLLPLLIVNNLFALYYMFFYFQKHVRIKVDEKHIFLFNKVLSNGIASKTFVLSVSLLSLSTRVTHLTTTASILFSVISSLYIILLYADCFYLPKKIREHFNEQFPQFKLV
jgi:hypothetical protein